MSDAALPVSAADGLVQLRGRLRWYAWWQLRDYLINKGIATGLISGLLLFVVWSGARSVGVADLSAVAAAAFPQFMSNLILFGVLFATNGIVSEDRKFGYYRFYFSKPVSAVEFYGQKFVVHVLGLLLVALCMLAVQALVFGPRFPRAFVPILLMLTVGLGGIGFMLSALFTLDWISLLAVYALSQVGWALYGDDAGIRGTLVHALPPVHRLDVVYAEVAREGSITMEPVWWVFLYGLACLGVGLFVISRRKLATS